MKLTTHPRAPRSRFGLALRLVVFGAAASLAPLQGQAQVVSTGSLLVIVEDEGGARIPGALVAADSTDSVTRRESVTDDRGEARLLRLEPSTRYVVTTSLTGFSGLRRERVLVRSGQTTTLRLTLELGGVTEQIVVTAESPVVDTTSATVGQDITLELTESLPTGRSYQSYLQLVPGVLPDDPTLPGNPAAKSGLNWRDSFGELGVSRDNFYYIDGINVTDPVQGTFGANLNTEIIQEQKVLTGGIPAEFVGTPGLLSNVVTKSGSDTFHGSVNYFFQNDGLVGENQNAEDQSFSSFDTAATLGGPIVRDRAWFFGSYRRLEREDDVVALDTNQLLRTVKREEDQFYGRVTWAPTARDTLAVTFLNDPTGISGRRDRDIPNSRDRRRVQGGDNFSARYSRILGALLVDVGYNKHNGEVTDLSVGREERNNVVFRRDDVRTIADENLGAFGVDLIDERDTEQLTASFQWEVSRHSVKGGFELLRNRNFRNTTQLGDGGRYTSVSTGLAGLTLGDLVGGSFTGRRFNPFSPSDFGGFLRTVNGLPNRDSFVAAFDLDGDGAITPQELAQGLSFTSSAGNPHGQLNYDRFLQTRAGDQDLGSKGLSFYLQDTARFGRFTIDAGIRTERFRHFDTRGDEIFTFDWTWAPRVSVAFDVRGDGRQKLTAFYGKYFDPIRNNMTQFAGSVTGAVFEEQVYANGEWVTYRTRGPGDASFAPTTQTPWTDDLQLGYQIDLGRSMSLEAIYTKRRTRDILEDYDLTLYAVGADGQTVYPGPLDDPDSLWLGPEYFGFSQAPPVNFIIATLAGAERDYQGVELVFRKRFSDGWQALASYSFNDAEGNSNSDSNADFAGDFLNVDPRAPNLRGRQVGSIRHIVKAQGSYRFDFGLELGGAYRWNSGTIGNRTQEEFSRHNPIQAEVPFEFAGITFPWTAPDAVGSYENPSFGLLDLRVQYIRQLGPIRGEFFVDVFNVFDDQDGIRLQDLVAGSGGVGFGEPVTFSTPRRLFLGTRLSF